MTACVREVGAVARGVVEQFLKTVRNEELVKNITSLAVPVYHVFGRGQLCHGELTQLFLQVPEFKPMLTGCTFRSVAYSIDKLMYILTIGIDVNPPSERIYTCQNIDKCIEYGGYPKIILCLDSSKLTNTWVHLPFDASESQRELILRDYPFSIKCEDGSELYSRIKDEPHRFSGYEWEYAKWIPGNPREALKSILIIDDGLGADTSEEDSVARLTELLSGKIESPEIPFIKKRLSTDA